ncbi:MAG: DUF2905 domain-containing protein [Candidatus Binataceae bacterium]
MAVTGKFLFFAGLIIAAFGLAFWISPSVPYIGRLPGDIYIKRGNFTFYFPLATAIILSIVLTVGLSLIRR